MSLRYLIDEDVLDWSAKNDRVLLSHDRRTLPIHLANRIVAGEHSPGILLLRNERLIELADFRLLVAFASDPEEWRDEISYVP